MKVIKTNLITKNNIKNGFYIYKPIVEVDGKFWFCESIKVSSPINENNIHDYQLKITREIQPEFYSANSLK